MKSPGILGVFYCMAHSRECAGNSSIVMEEKRELTLSKEIHPGIYRISLPLHVKNPGPVNAYLFTGETITLLDTGLSQTSKILERALAEHDLQFSDIDQIIITHGHLEHYGAARTIVKKSARKPAVAAHIEDIIRIETGSDVPISVYTAFSKQMGVPARFRLFSFLLGSLFFTLSRSCTVTMPLRDNDTLQLGNYRGKVISTPGHTRGSICIYLESEKILFSGDHILKHITPNAFVMFQEDKNLPARFSQIEYFDSISKIEKLSPSVVFTGHRNHVENLEEITRVYKGEFQKRQSQILSILEDGEQTGYEISKKLFPILKKKKFPLLLLEIFLSLSEVYTHLQVLNTEGLTSSVSRGKLLYFRKL